MPQTHLEAATPTITYLNLKTPLSKLGRLASGMSQKAWEYRDHRPETVDASARRAVRWYEIAREGIKAFQDARITAGTPLWNVKRQTYLWLLRKHQVLLDALNRGDILPIDVLDAVVRGFSSYGN